MLPGFDPHHRAAKARPAGQCRPVELRPMLENPAEEHVTVHLRNRRRSWPCSRLWKMPWRLTTIRIFSPKSFAGRSLVTRSMKTGTRRLLWTSCLVHRAIPLSYQRPRRAAFSTSRRMIRGSGANRAENRGRGVEGARCGRDHRPAVQRGCQRASRVSSAHARDADDDGRRSVAGANPHGRCKNSPGARCKADCRAERVVLARR
jgi:hypothetical protein